MILKIKSDKRVSPVQKRFRNQLDNNVLVLSNNGLSKIYKPVRNNSALNLNRNKLNSDLKYENSIGKRVIMTDMVDIVNITPRVKINQSIKEKSINCRCIVF